MSGSGGKGGGGRRRWRDELEVEVNGGKSIFKANFEKEVGMVVEVECLVWRRWSRWRGPAQLVEEVPALRG